MTAFALTLACLLQVWIISPIDWLTQCHNRIDEGGAQ